jgi:hypothetical protein
MNSAIALLVKGMESSFPSFAKPWSAACAPQHGLPDCHASRYVIPLGRATKPLFFEGVFLGDFGSTPRYAHPDVTEGAMRLMLAAIQNGAAANPVSYPKGFS